MADTLTVTATEFARNFGAYREQAFGVEVLKVTRNGRVVGAYLSAKELEHFERLKRREREVFKVGELPPDLFEDIKAAEYGSTVE